MCFCLSHRDISLSTTTQRRSRLQHRYCIGVSRRSTQVTVSEGLTHGPYMAARAGVEPTTLRLKSLTLPKRHYASPTGVHSFIHLFIPAISMVPLQVHYYSEALSTTARILCRSFTPKRHRQLRVKDLPKVPTWRLERD